MQLIIRVPAGVTEIKEDKLKYFTCERSFGQKNVEHTLSPECECLILVGVVGEPAGVNGRLGRQSERAKPDALRNGAAVQERLNKIINKKEKKKKATNLNA